MITQENFRKSSTHTIHFRCSGQLALQALLLLQQRETTKTILVFLVLGHQDHDLQWIGFYNDLLVTLSVGELPFVGKTGMGAKAEVDDDGAKNVGILGSKAMVAAKAFRRLRFTLPLS